MTFLIKLYNICMNIRLRKIITYRVLSIVFLLVSIGLSAFVLSKVISLRPEKIVLDLIALGLVMAFALGQIILIIRGWKKESALLDVAFNTDNTVNKLALVFVLAGTALGLGLDILTIVVLTTRATTTSLYCSMFIILSIASYLLLNCAIYLAFTLIFRKRELTLKDYAK